MGRNVPDELGTMGIDRIGYGAYGGAMLTTIPAIIEAFGGPAAYAREVGMTPGAAKQAARRGSLDAKWFAPTARAAARRDIPVTVDTLAAIAETRRAA